MKSKKVREVSDGTTEESEEGFEREEGSSNVRIVWDHRGCGKS